MPLEALFIRALVYDDAGLHPGFMHVGAALVVAPAAQDGRHSSARRTGKFRGMVLEKLNGHTVAAALGSKRTGVQDVQKIRSMLFQAGHHSAGKQHMQYIWVVRTVSARDDLFVGFNCSS